MRLPLFSQLAPQHIENHEIQSPGQAAHLAPPPGDSEGRRNCKQSLVQGVDEDLPLLVSHVLDLETVVSRQGGDIDHQLVQRTGAPQQGVRRFDDIAVSSSALRAVWSAAFRFRARWHDVWCHPVVLIS